jgi:8-oxo-dGTP pyrophosphatase MutT (NUDIX family)
VETTWDGVPVASDKPFAASIVVWRQVRARREYLLLHRAHNGPDYDGDWAWTSPAGARQPGEETVAAARRELREETGLELAMQGPLDHVTDEVALFAAEAPANAVVRLDAEHDRFEWVSLEEGMRRCLPTAVAEALRVADSWSRTRDVPHPGTSGG